MKLHSLRVIFPFSTREEKKVENAWERKERKMKTGKGNNKPCFLLLRRTMKGKGEKLYNSDAHTRERERERETREEIHNEYIKYTMTLLSL